MKANTIRLLEVNAEITLKAGLQLVDLFNYAIDNDTSPTEIKKMELNDVNLKVAKEWLSNKKNTRERTEGYSGAYYKITAYAIEYFMEDEDGNFIDGSDYDSAEDEII